MRTLILSSIRRLRVYDGQVIELRALNVPPPPGRYGSPRTVAGWFDNIEALADAAMELERRRPRGIFVTLNDVNRTLLGRANNHVVEYQKTTTTTGDITRRLWLPFDVDSVRPSGISATVAELNTAKRRAIEAQRWLRRQLGQPPDVWGFSGNGYHLLFRVDMPNRDDVTEWIKAIIHKTADRFSDDRVTVDRAVFDANRIWRLYGTKARKGDDVPSLGRRHRRTGIRKELFRK